MDPKELFDYTIDGVKWLAAGGATYIVTLIGLCAAPRLFSERIKSQDDLDKIVKEETERLGMTKRILARFHNTWREDTAKYSMEGRLLDYMINIGGFGARRTMVRHELYHIHKGHFEHPLRRRGPVLRELHYLFIAEPQAIAYQFKLKL